MANLKRANLKKDKSEKEQLKNDDSEKNKSGNGLI